MTPEPLSGTAQAPSPYTGTRTTTIAAPTERVHALTDDVREWPQWSPWRASTRRSGTPAPARMPGSVPLS